VNYTYQIVKGSASDPQQMRNAITSGSLPEVQFVYLNWDQRHTVNFNVNYSAKKWGGSLIGNYGSGQPYTPRKSTDISELLTNTQRKPFTYNLDARFYYRMAISNFRFDWFLKIYNVLDNLNEVNVFDDTGRAGYTTDILQAKKTGWPEFVNTIEEYYWNPSHYSEPRRIELGVQVDF